MTLYHGSDGRTYTEQEMWSRFEDRQWRVFCWDADSGLEVVENEQEELVFLKPLRSKGSKEQ